MKRIAFRMVMIVLVLALLANTALAATNWETLRPYFEQHECSRRIGTMVEQ